MTVYHKPSGMTQFMNRVLGWFAGIGLTPGHMIIIEARGRRSGQTRSAVVNSVDYEGQTYLVSPRGETEWVRNVRAAGGDSVIRHGSRHNVRLEEIPAAERAPILQKYLKQNAMATKAHFGIEPDAPLPEFQRVAASHPVFRAVEAGTTGEG